MDLSRLRTRRNILALALAGAATRVASARALQSTAGCDIGFTNGLLTIGGADCKLLSPAGMDGASIGLPPQMVDARTTSAPVSSSGGTSSSTTSQGTSTTGTTTTSSPSTTTSTTSPQAERQARLQEHRDKKRRKRGRKTDQKQTQKGRQQTRKKTRLDAQEEQDRLASMAHCSDFKDQKEAIEYLAQFTDEWETLDPDRDKVPCEDLKAVTCNQLRLEEGAGLADPDDIENAVQSWLKRSGFSGSNNALGLNADKDGVVCPPKTTSDATTEGLIANG